MCGKETGLFKTLIEGSEVDVCESCSGFGEVIKEANEDNLFFEKRKATNISGKKIFYILENCSKLIKENRERLGLKQEQLAKKLSLKESIIHKIESGNIEPDMDLAKKFEKFFGIQLIDSYEEKKETKTKEDYEEVTIGDLLKEKD